MIVSQIVLTREMDDDGEMSMSWELNDDMSIIEALGMIELAKHDMLNEEMDEE